MLIMECGERSNALRINANKSNNLRSYSFSNIIKRTIMLIMILMLIGPLNNVKFVNCNNITKEVFGDMREGIIIAAFGDFDSDELTDVFIISNDMTTLEILYGSETEPLLKSGPYCQYERHYITSVVPGDFDGDALMDVMVTLRPKNQSPQDKDIYHVYINWGGANILNCTSDTLEQPLLITKGEPLAIDYDRNMVIDLYGQKADEDKRTYWVFQGRSKPTEITQVPPAGDDIKQKFDSINIPNANAYLDLNDDFTADLFVQTADKFEIWYGRTHDAAYSDFTFSHFINIRIDGMQPIKLGQAIFADNELKGSENIILPVCIQKYCANSTLLVHNGKADGSFHDIHVTFRDPQGITWGFVEPIENDVYLKTITARSGDYNMDGYPDLLMTLQTLSGPKRLQTFLLENVPCKVCNNPLKRTFEVKWNAFNPMGNSTVAGAFYDFYQDGVLDVILIERTPTGQYRPLAFRNTLDYDANFVKVIVLTGLFNKDNSTQRTTLGLKRRTYGTNLPGPRITYSTTTQEGDLQCGSSAQLPQSAYFALQLPYTIFGLGRTPNFVDSLTVGLGNRLRTWTQLIPNSQIIVVPKPVSEPAQWKAQLFVTPSKLILMSVVALGGTCMVIVLIILVLYIKEKREDKQEKLQEAHRFHFDAM